MKIKAYLGFAYKSGNVVLGIEQLKKTRKTVPLVLVSESLSENGVKEIEKLAKDKNWLVLKDGNALKEVFTDKNVKILGIADINIANAIINEIKQ